MTSEYLTTAEVGEMLRTPAETIRFWRHVGKGPKSFKLPGGRRVLYARADVEQYLADARAAAGIYDDEEEEPNTGPPSGPVFAQRVGAAQGSPPRRRRGAKGAG